MASGPGMGRCLQCRKSRYAIAWDMPFGWRFVAEVNTSIALMIGVGPAANPYPSHA